MPALIQRSASLLAAVLAGAILGLVAPSLVTPSPESMTGNPVVARVELAATKVPKVLKFMTKKCANIHKNGCWWRDTNGKAPNLSFYAVPFPGGRKCIVFWYKPGLRYCTRADAKIAAPPAG
jgi:hypothetical protein